MPPLRVAIVADVLLSEMGGVSRSVLGIARELAGLDPERVEVTLVARGKPSGIDGIPFRKSFSPRVPKLPDALFALQRPFTLKDFDVVHYMDSRPPFDFPCGRSPKAVTQHGFAALMFGDENMARRMVYVNKALLRLAPFADLTFTPSESERREILARVKIDPARIVAVHHGVDHDRFYPPGDLAAARAEVRARFGLPPRYVLFVANYQYKKNPERLVEAFARVSAGTPELGLALAGWQTPRFQFVLDLIDRLGVESKVHVLGHVGDEALRGLYAGAELFALTSLHESFGMPALEAMACGAPVLASRVYSLPEICGDAAEFVDPYSVDDIAEGLRRILDEPGRAAELRRRGFAQAARFTWRRCAERHLAAYEDLCR
jgi:glycosyltransferase involved in cell wall biosynthesis